MKRLISSRGSPRVYFMGQVILPLESSIFSSTDSWNIDMKYIKPRVFPPIISFNCSRTNFDSISSTLSFSCTDFCCLLMLVLGSSFWFSSVASFVLCEPFSLGNYHKNDSCIQAVDHMHYFKMSRLLIETLPQGIMTYTKIVLILYSQLPLSFSL